jgi:hypothetical protein
MLAAADPKSDLKPYVACASSYQEQSASIFDQCDFG